MTNPEGIREWAKLSDLKPGDKVEFNGGSNCLSRGVHNVQATGDGELFVRCTHGKHFLDAAKDRDGKLIGFFPA